MSPHTWGLSIENYNLFTYAEKRHYDMVPAPYPERAATMTRKSSAMSFGQFTLTFMLFYTL